MWVYIMSEHCAEYSLYTVGFYKPDGTWEPEYDTTDKDEAVERVAKLNGQRVCQNCGLKRSLDEALNSGDGVYRP